MERNITILGTGRYVPSNKVYNEFFIEHFDKLGMKAEGLMNHLGRRKRYLATENDTSLSMGFESAKNALENFNVSPEEIDMIVFATDTPEYLIPTNSLKIADMLQATNAKMVFDLNSNCSGMLTAMDVVASYMKGKPDIKKALIVGSFLISIFAKETDTVVYPNLADSSVTLILEAKEEEVKRGLIDSDTRVDASYHSKLTLPECGFSKMGHEHLDGDRKKFFWDPFDLSFLADMWAELIKEVLDRNGVTPQEVDYYVFSQVSDPNNMATLDKLGVGEDKYFFVGKEYGYTGVTCPGLVLNRMWNVIAKEGNKVIFCSVGAGVSIIAQLYIF